MSSPLVTLHTWENLLYNVSEVADDVEHRVLPQLLIGHVRCVVSGTRLNAVKESDRHLK